MATAFEASFLDRSRGSWRKTPFTEPIGLRGTVVCFASDADSALLWSDASRDIEDLAALKLGRCHYGAADYPIHPVVATIPRGVELTGAAVLRALRVRAFGSAHIRDLDRVKLPHPGYQPHTANDEIHTDASAQFLFYVSGRDDDDDDDDDLEGPEVELARRSAAAHEGLGALVEGPLHYVVLHEDSGRGGQLVALFAVGRSRRSAHLIGVASQQVCHNLCD